MLLLLRGIRKFIIWQQKERKKKSGWIDTWKDRSEEQRMLDFLDGQLGEEGFRKFLKNNEISYQYYDDIRTDDFKEKDLFDFMLVNRMGNKIEVSVKASKLKKSIADTVERNNILAYPQQVKAITVQPFIDYPKKEIVLVGWASKEQLEKIPPGYLPGFFSDRGVRYHKLKIRDSNPMSTLVSFLDSQQ